ncbi:ABC-type anion transport system ATPase component [Ignavibacterium album JCM 16511]|uniref:ABC-type anion transport system ATPase component n=1 Tax=Ignavibacterium album (strain DSM 19864 / JCM 16511 / NBRC 101810 / Mat9-16) TaxID=945713 RepID=I0AKF3_IGNAJ|nr:ATP-binding cassette domain-containing protein [Ignavibacterium album]AFH49460.1 ABC-type anion transport system ATPase component [Ignavibacterium album JCM 16511]
MVISISNISKSFLIEEGFDKKVLNDLNLTFDFNENKIISLIAPFVSGKSTFLKIIAGLIHPDSGKIIVNENEVDKKPGNIVYIPTEPVSIPWLNVKQNLEIGMSEEKISDEKTKFILNLIGLEGYEEHFPDKNSFGFRFRITLGSALYSNPKLILLDEPFNKLDWLTKAEIFSMIKSVVTQTGSKFLLATSNLLDAIFLSDEVILLTDVKKPLVDYYKIEKRFSDLSEIMKSDYLTNIFNKIQSMATNQSGFIIKNFSI